MRCGMFPPKNYLARLVMNIHIIINVYIYGTYTVYITECNCSVIHVFSAISVSNLKIQ